MFLTTEERLTEKLNKEKEYLWTEMNALKAKLEKTNQQLELLEQSAPEHYSKALGARNKATEVKNKAEERLGEIDAIYKSVEDAHNVQWHCRVYVMPLRIITIYADMRDM